MRWGFKMSAQDIAFSGIYLALILLMGYTPYIGFVTIGPNTIALILIPVAIATIHYGWKGAILSFMAFGFVSFSAGLYIPGTHHALVIEPHGLGTWFIISFFGRVLAGIGTALVALAVRKVPLYLRMWILAITVGVMNTIGFIGLLDAYLDSVKFLIYFASKGINLAIEWVAVPFIVMAFYPFLKHYLKK